MDNGMKTAVLDTCILSLGEADPVDCFLVDTQSRFISNKLLVFKLKENKNIDRLKMMQAIGRAARKNIFSACVTHEINMENMNGYQSFITNISPLYAFRNINWGRSLESPIERSKLFQVDNFMNGSAVTEFVNFLLNCNAVRLIDLMRKRRDIFTDFEIHCAENINRFRYLCREDVLHQKRARDVFHFWTTECHGVDYFVTKDLKLYNSYQEAVKRGRLISKTKMVSPEDFIEDLNIKYDDIRLPELGREYTLFDVTRFTID